MSLSVLPCPRTCACSQPPSYHQGIHFLLLSMALGMGDPAASSTTAFKHAPLYPAPAHLPWQALGRATGPRRPLGTRQRSGLARNVILEIQQFRACIWT